MAKNTLVSDKELKLSATEKMQFIDQEIQLLLDFCLKSGLNHRQIEENALPLLRCVDAASRKKWPYVLVGFITLIITISGLFYFDPTQQIIYIYGRYMSIQVLPVWDWTNLYYSNCLMENPFYLGNKPQKGDCQVCEDLMAIERVQNASWQQMTDFLKNEVPVIVEDGLRDWENLEDELRIESLLQIHLDMDKFSPCGFTSNFRSKQTTSSSIITRVLDYDIKKWYMHWANCEKSNAKVLRGYYIRPYFLPPMVETTESNWIFVSSDYFARSFKEVPFLSNMLWFAQIHGENTIQLSSKAPCSNICPIFTETLNEGDILIVTGFLWDMAYMPIGGEENVAIAAGGYIDD